MKNKFLLFTLAIGLIVTSMVSSAHTSNRFEFGSPVSRSTYAVVENSIENNSKSYAIDHTYTFPRAEYFSDSDIIHTLVGYVGNKDINDWWKLDFDFPNTPYSPPAGAVISLVASADCIVSVYDEENNLIGTSDEYIILPAEPNYTYFIQVEFDSSRTGYNAVPYIINVYNRYYTD